MCCTHLEPLVDTLGMKLVQARQNAQKLATLKVAHAHHARRLVHVVASHLTVETIAGQLLDLHLGQSPRFGFTQTLRQVQ